jgi:hypothetical protein
MLLVTNIRVRVSVCVCVAVTSLYDNVCVFYESIKSIHILHLSVAINVPYINGMRHLLLHKRKVSV